MTTATLGEAGIPHDDETYTGDVSSSPISLDYFRSKFTEFQQSLNAADQAYRAGVEAFAIYPFEDVGALLTEYEAKASTLKLTAEAMNAGAAVVNAAGGRMPVLSIPSTLGLPPLLMPAAVIAAIGAAASYVGWALGYAQAMNDAIGYAENIVSDPQQKSALVAALTKARDAVAIGNGSGLSMLAGPLKIAAIGGLLFLAWRAFGGVSDD